MQTEENNNEKVEYWEEIVEKKRERAKLKKGRFNSLHCLIVYVNTLNCQFIVVQMLISEYRDK